MAREERDRWDARYVAGDWADSRRPARIVTDAAPWLHPAGSGDDAPRPPGPPAGDDEHAHPAGGRGPVALDVACGPGRNALHLARRGYRVLAVDLSLQGLRRLHGRLVPGDRVQPVLADLEAFGVRPGAFDLVVNTRFLLRETFSLLRAALAPGGLLLFETYSVHEIEELGGDVRRAYALERGELREAFGGFETLLYEEGIFPREEGERGLARLIARKPA